jgi:hypothetical protein
MLDHNVDFMSFYSIGKDSNHILGYTRVYLYRYPLAVICKGERFQNIAMVQHRDVILLLIGHVFSLSWQYMNMGYN